MAAPPLAEIVEIAVRQLTSEEAADVENHPEFPEEKERESEHETDGQNPDLGERQESIESLLYSASKTLCLRLDTIEAHLNSMEDKCKLLRAKVDMLATQGSFRQFPTSTEQSNPREESQAAESLVLPLKRTASDSNLPEETLSPKQFRVDAEEEIKTSPASKASGDVGDADSQLHIMALCPDGKTAGEKDSESIPDSATNLLYHLMY